MTYNQFTNYTMANMVEENAYKNNQIVYQVGELRKRMYETKVLIESLMKRQDEDIKAFESIMHLMDTNAADLRKELNSLY